MQTEYCVDTSSKEIDLVYFWLVTFRGTVSCADGEDIPAETLNEFYENIWAERFGCMLSSNQFLRKRIT